LEQEVVAQTVVLCVGLLSAEFVGAVSQAHECTAQAYAGAKGFSLHRHIIFDRALVAGNVHMFDNELEP